MNCFYTQDVIYSYYDKLISDLLINNRKNEAQNKAFEWLQEYVNALCITVPWNWKIAKKQIAAFFFGMPHSIYLYYSDGIDKAINFIKGHSDNNVRCTIHRFNTACHSESRRITLNNVEWLKGIKESMSPQDIIDIFVECSSSKTTCFRRFSLQYNEEISYEMGYGQAMYVFETERGKHDVAGINYFNGIWSMEKALDFHLTNYLQQLIRFHEMYLSLKTHCICYYLGIPQISIEGYFNTDSPAEKPIIVDIDLPFDRAFF